MQHLSKTATHTGVVALPLLAGVLWIMGCQELNQSPDTTGARVDSDVVWSQTTGGMRVPEGEQASVGAELSRVLSGAAFKPAVEECCTNVGKKDECWWEDAVHDGVTCMADKDCPSKNCIKNLIRPGVTDTSGESLGLCACNATGANLCNDELYGMSGICMFSPDDPADTDTSGSGQFVCGPSFCNGYLKCSCFGGCEWWYQTTDTDKLDWTPNDVAAEQGDGVLCCEGNYPIGGRSDGGVFKIVTYYGEGSCNPEVSVQCINDAECNDNSPCTIDVCNSTTNLCEYIDAADGVVCSVDSDTTDCYGPWECVGGFCVHVNPPYADSDPCGEPDTDPNDCVDGHFCMSAVCLPDNRAVGDQCNTGLDTDTNNCLDGFECDASQQCIQVNTPAATPCFLDTDDYPPNCWYGAYCGKLDTDTTVLPPNPGTPNTGACMEVKRLSATNEDCNSAEALADFTGSVAQSVTVTGSTVCAVNNYQSAGNNCLESINSAVQLGANAGDVVYSFTYTPDPAATSLYAFLVTVDADFDVTVYAKGNDCSDTTADNPCMRHPGPTQDFEGFGWEYSVNYTGENWSGDTQQCAAGNYEWCSRDAGAWSYPKSPTMYQFDNSGGITPAPVSSPYKAQTVIFPVNDGTVTPQTYHVIVDGADDGAGGGTRGNFSLTVKGQLWNNGQCERVFDDPRVYDATRFGTYNGNITDFANSTHDTTTISCAGYACGDFFDGVTAIHDPVTANALWPAQAFFKLRPSAKTTYCLSTVAPPSNALTNPVIEVRTVPTTPVSAQHDLCSTEYAVTAADSGSTGIKLDAQANVTYLVLISDAMGSTVPCSGNCNYSLRVEDASVTGTVCDAPLPVGGCTLATANELGPVSGVLKGPYAGDACLKISSYSPTTSPWDGTIKLQRFISASATDGGGSTELSFTWTNGTVSEQPESFPAYNTDCSFVLNDKTQSVLIDIGGAHSDSFWFDYFWN
ncbi:MAG: hypothetical protein JXR76_05775 [Deltaproteobacteria bacterium]|nr:hypothetical protein [Deltaproteobacteria bacterium]